MCHNRGKNRGGKKKNEWADGIWNVSVMSCYTREAHSDLSQSWVFIFFLAELMTICVKVWMLKSVICRWIGWLWYQMHLQCVDAVNSGLSGKELDCPLLLEKKIMPADETLHSKSLMHVSPSSHLGVRQRQTSTNFQRFHQRTHNWGERLPSCNPSFGHLRDHHRWWIPRRRPG